MRAGLSHGIVVGASSDIGLAVVRDWLGRGISVTGTYRTSSAALDAVAHDLAGLIHCDFASRDSMNALLSKLRERESSVWDYLLVCPGTMEPVGPFSQIDIDHWSACFEINFMATMRIVHGLLPLRRQGCEPPLVLLFAGGGTNSAPLSFSAYTAAKIALIKSIELLDAEMPDVRFTILGPGWVRTKIHEETLHAEHMAESAAIETRRRLMSDDFNPISRVVDCVAWAMQAPKEIIGGRNFSVVHDLWGRPELTERLMADANMYKLRRSGN